MTEPAMLADVTGYNDLTLGKVRKALGAAGLTEQVIDDAVTGMQNEGILFREAIDKPDPRDISDGYHTMYELDEHRRALTAVLATIGAVNGDAWRSLRHHPEDQPMYDGYFIVGVELPAGTISYHYPLSAWSLFGGVPEVETAPKWDGHTPGDVVATLHDFARKLTDGLNEMRGAVAVVEGAENE